MKLIFLLFISLNVFALDCKTHPVYCHIKRISPNIETKKAIELSNLFYKYSKQFKLNPHISVAIAMQESSLKNRNRYEYGAEFLAENVRLTRVATDIGLFQIHINTAKYYKIDIFKLKNDLDYAFYWHFKILSDKIKQCSRLGKDAWTCYHSKTPKFRKIYKQKVEKYL